MNEITIELEEITNVQALGYPSGTLFKVPWGEEVKFYIRTDLQDYPFVDLKDGTVSCQGGSFTLIPLPFHKIHLSK